MDRTTHRRTVALAALALLLAGCGAENDSGAGGSGTVSPSPTASSPTTTPSDSASPTASDEGCEPAPTELSAADSGHTYCLATGGVLRISLDGTTARPWKAVAVDGSALEATNSGIVLPPGDASSAFEAVSAGTAELTSSRPLCAIATKPGQVSCKGIQEWAVTVVVSNR